MSDVSANLNLPYILAAQAQKHVTHNEAIRALDAIVHLGVLDRDLADPPASPAEGDRYLIAAAPTGAWAGRAGDIAAFQDGAWAFLTPREGWRAWVSDEARLLVHDGAGWTAVAGEAEVNPAPLVGVNAVADAVNRLTVKSDAVLFSHDDVTPGSGDMRLALNKADAGGVASVVFQNGYSGRAEFGLAAGDLFELKVSTDGVDFASALSIDPADGVAQLPQGGVLGTGGEAVELYARGDEVPGYGVPVLRAAGANAPTALDIMPNGTGGVDITGKAWIHVLRQDLKTAADPNEWQACTVAARGDEVAIGAMSGGSMPVLPLSVAGSVVNIKSKLTGAGTVTYAIVRDTGFQLCLNETQVSSVWMFRDWTRYKAAHHLRWTATTAAHDTPDTGIGRNAAGVVEINNGTAGTFAQLRVRSVRVASYTVATVPSASAEGAGAVIYVSDASVGATLAVSDGSAWRMLTSAVLS